MSPEPPREPRFQVNIREFPFRKRRENEICLTVSLFVTLLLALVEFRFFGPYLEIISSRMDHLIFVNVNSQENKFKDQERDAELDEIETPDDNFKMASSSRKRRQKKLSFDSDSDSDKENA